MLKTMKMLPTRNFPKVVMTATRAKTKAQTALTKEEKVMEDSLMIPLEALQEQ